MRVIKVLCLLGSLGALPACSADGGTHSGHAQAGSVQRVGAGHRVQNIFGGTKVSNGDPIALATVALMQPDGWSFCSGTLIDRRHVVTAAHCLADYQEGELYVGFGTDVGSAGNLVPGSSPTSILLRLASDYVINNGFDPSTAGQMHPSHAPHDIALLTLGEDAPTGYVPMPMLTAADALNIGEPLILAGFGLSDADGEGPGQLRQVTTTLVGVWPAAEEIEYGDTPGKSACNGDSGGPAYVTRGGTIKLVGVTSRGITGCGAGGIYTDVRSHQAWLEQAAQG